MKTKVLSLHELIEDIRTQEAEKRILLHARVVSVMLFMAAVLIVII